MLPKQAATEPAPAAARAQAPTQAGDGGAQLALPPRAQAWRNSRYQVVLPKTRVISQRHNQAPNAPAPTWNRQLLRPNHCSGPQVKDVEPIAMHAGD